MENESAWDAIRPEATGAYGVEASAFPKPCVRGSGVIGLPDTFKAELSPVCTGT